MEQNYYGVYIPIRLRDETQIYDYRIIDYRENYKIFSKLVTFNLAIILAQKLNINFFRGVLSNGEEKYFRLDLVNPLNRFVMVSEFDDQPYLAIYNNDTMNFDKSFLPKPFIKIFNYEGISNTLEIALDFVDSGNNGPSGIKFNTIVCSRSDISVLTDASIGTHLLVYENNTVYSCIQGFDGYNYKTDLKKVNLTPEGNSNYYICLKSGDEEIRYISLDEGEFKSLLFSCLPTPLITDDEIAIGERNINNYDDLYIDIGGRWALAIDPSAESKDKDDAIFFEETDTTYTMYVYISDVSPFMNSENDYIYK